MYLNLWPYDICCRCGPGGPKVGGDSMNFNGLPEKE